MNRRSLLKLSLASVPAVATMRAAYADGAELLVGCDTSFMPFEFKQGDAYVGFDIDLWTEIAKGIGRTWRLQSLDFTGLIPALQTRNIDVALSGMTIRDHRRKVIDFSDPYYDSGLIAVVRTDNTAIHSSADLDGKEVGAKTGTATIDFLKTHVKGMTLHQFPTSTTPCSNCRRAGSMLSCMTRPTSFITPTPPGRAKFA